MASTSYEVFQLLELLPANVKRVGMGGASAERSGDAWVLHLDPDEHLRYAHWPGGEDRRLQPVEDLLLDRGGFFSMVVVEGADYGPEIAERIERMSPEIPKRFDWKGAPPYRIPLYRGDDAPF